ncbi:unnamed protein product [Lampetra planeri]
MCAATAPATPPGDVPSGGKQRKPCWSVSASVLLCYAMTLAWQQHSRSKNNNKKKPDKREDGGVQNEEEDARAASPRRRPRPATLPAVDATGDAHLADAIEPGARLPDPASPTPTQGGEEPPTAAGATGVPGGAAAPGSPSSPAPTGGKEVTTEPEGNGLPEGSGLPGLGSSQGGPWPQTARRR